MAMDNHFFSQIFLDENGRLRRELGLLERQQAVAWERLSREVGDDRVLCLWLLGRDENEEILQTLIRDDRDEKSA